MEVLLLKPDCPTLAARVEGLQIRRRLTGCGLRNEDLREKIPLTRSPLNSLRSEDFPGGVQAFIALREQEFCGR
jgi:hypothetical protein